MGSDIKKKVFLVVSSDETRLNLVSESVKKYCENCMIYTAPDGGLALLKIKNTPPDVLITDLDLPKLSGLKLVDAVLANDYAATMAAIIIGHPPEKEKFVDQLLTGRVHFIDEKVDASEFSHSLARALNFGAINEHTEFSLRFLADGDLLIKEGDRADNIYILRKGRLNAFSMSSGHKINLGYVEVGEFVGEMAYINGEPRTASVEAVGNCELIEVPVGTVEKVLYKRPAWSKALMQTLSKRLKQANKTKKV